MSKMSEHALKVEQEERKGFFEKRMEFRIFLAELNPYELELIEDDLKLRKAYEDDCGIVIHNMQEMMKRAVS